MKIQKEVSKIDRNANKGRQVSPNTKNNKSDLSKYLSKNNSPSNSKSKTKKSPNRVSGKRLKKRMLS